MTSPWISRASSVALLYLTLGCEPKQQESQQTAARVPATPSVTPCRLQFGDPQQDATLCYGVPQFALDEPQSAKANATWVGNLPFSRFGEEEERVPDTATGANPRVQVQVIDRAERVDLSQLGTGEIVMARFTVTREKAKPEKRYKLWRGKADGDFKDMFYLAVSGYTQGAPHKGGRIVATWRMYGVTPSGRLKRIARSEGSLVLCDTTHEAVKVHGALFWSCTRHNADAALLSRMSGTVPPGQTLLSNLTGADMFARESLALDSAPNRKTLASGDLQLLRQAFAGAGDEPAWLVCGPGCCTAEEFLQSKASIDGGQSPSRTQLATATRSRRAAVSSP